MSIENLKSYGESPVYKSAQDYPSPASFCLVARSQHHEAHFALTPRKPALAG